ncbi:PREDICTED: UDP-glycosyltransferase 89A2-like [Camelina sativa]|uniref:UDP-glycosyltransferase 89A2-like n=1 Tax=Camelina sativa TaxID=90675 RepID=A0ABM0X2E3_CAMSA|nr:PREDICTED: UDP-glycosyltransferase 89A2-like [Camelina sativa]
MNGAMPQPLPETKRCGLKPHITVFPYPAQGHFLPLLDLTHQLCLRALTVSVIVTPKNLPYLSSLLSAHPSSVSAVTLPFPHHPLIPSGVENVKDLGCSGNPLIMASLCQLREPILNWLSSHPNPPVALISDFFLAWTKDLGVPRFAFFSSGAFLASILHFVSDNLHVFESTEPVCLSDLPGSPVFRTEHLPALFPQFPSSQDESDCAINFSSYGCIFNSCECLEEEYMEFVKQNVSQNRVFGVGPLSSTGLRKGDSDSDVDAKALLSWLDGCPDGSVLYICFGSQKALSKDQCDALALGLEKSMTRFVWVVKKDPIPDGFEDRVAGRGKIVRGWAPQVVMLSHVAVGGFLSHCGWNSVLEAMASGTMVLAWPMEADQFVDARLLVDHMGVAVSVCEGGKTVPEPHELSRVIGETMGEGGREMRARAKDMGQKAQAATAAGGSSTEDLERLVKELSSL